MMILTVTDEKISSEDGAVWLCLKVTDHAAARRFCMAQDKPGIVYDVEIKAHKDKRSLDANGLYWSLVGELSKAVHEKPEAIYRSHIKDIGNYETLCMQKGALESFKERWCSRHLGRMVETRASKLPGCVTVLAYYGSSDFDKQQMSHLIDNCIQDCRAVGVETMPPDKIALLKEEWGK